jgi:hypothetical protein
MNTLRCFPRESMNFRRGSDVPEGGESQGVARNSFARLVFETATRIEQGGEEGARLTVRRILKP